LTDVTFMDKRSIKRKETLLAIPYTMETRQIKIHNLFILLFGSEYRKNYKEELFSKDISMGIMEKRLLENKKDLLLEETKRYQK
jgi:hypothetical protein